MRPIPVLLLLMLPACSGGERADYNDVGKLSRKDAAAANAIDAAVAQNGVAAVAAKGAPVTAPPRDNSVARRLPTGFQGYWGRRPLDCDLANYDAKGRLLIDGANLRFHDAKAQVEQIETTSPAAVVADLAFSGEGRRWQRRTTLRLDAGGTVLLRSDDASAAVLRYKHC